MFKVNNKDTRQVAVIIVRSLKLEQIPENIQRSAITYNNTWNVEHENVFLFICFHENLLISFFVLLFRLVAVSKWACKSF